jgi:hypothetical protein
MTEHPSPYSLQAAQASLRHLLGRSLRRVQSLANRSSDRPAVRSLKVRLQTSIDHLALGLEKLDRQIIRVAAFGLVSRGKSAVLNALLGEPLFLTGPLHGVTQWPQSVRWRTHLPLAVELIDTPGLDEIDGEARAEMAKTVAQQADLILFVVAGDITRTEYQALSELWRSHKPLLLVFNKTDLYPDIDCQAIQHKLKTLSRTCPGQLPPLITPDDMVLVAAEPAPLQVRTEWPNGRMSYDWETPPAHIAPLRDKLLEIVQRDGSRLLALNVLHQSRDTEMAIAHDAVEALQIEAEALIWRFARYKALAIALNPIGLFDVLGGAIADLALIRALARLYGLPMTSHEANRLWRTILWSSGGLLMGEMASSFFLGVAKSAAAVAGTFESPAHWSTYVSLAATQGAIAGYGIYTVGRAAQAYLENGSTWGRLGPSTLIQTLLHQDHIQHPLDRLRYEVEQEL